MKMKIAGLKPLRIIVAAALLALPITIITGCAVTSGRETVGQYTDDKATTARVKTALARDSIVKAHQVNVTTFQGVVQLSGFVDSQEQKDRATEIVRNIQGVQELHNDLVVPTGRSSGDAGLKSDTDVKADAEIKAGNVEVKGEVDVDKK